MSKLEGYLLKKNGSAFRNDWRKRYFVCDGDRLAWYDDSDPRFEGAAGKPKGVVFVGADATFKPVPSKRIPHRFLLTARKAHGSKATKALDLAADSIDDLARWERALTGAGAPLPADAPEHAASVRARRRRRAGAADAAGRPKTPRGERRTLSSTATTTTATPTASSASRSRRRASYARLTSSRGALGRPLPPTPPTAPGRPAPAPAPATSPATSCARGSRAHDAARPPRRSTVTRRTRARGPAPTADNGAAASAPAFARRAAHADAPASASALGAGRWVAAAARGGADASSSARLLPCRR